MSKEISQETKVINQPLVDLSMVPGLTSSWEDILRYCLACRQEAYEGHAERLKMLYTNFCEFFEEYGQLRQCTQEELLAVLYYLGKKYEDDKMPPTGKDLKFIHLLLNKRRNTAQSA